MLIEEVDVIEPEPFERCVGNASHVFGRTVETRDMTRGARFEFEAEFRRHEYVRAPTAKRAAEQLFVRKRSVRLGGIEERDPEIERAMDRRDRFVVDERSIRLTHSHTTEAECRYRWSVTSELARFHRIELRVSVWRTPLTFAVSGFGAEIHRRSRAAEYLREHASPDTRARLDDDNANRTFLEPKRRGAARGALTITTSASYARSVINVPRVRDLPRTRMPRAHSLTRSQRRLPLRANARRPLRSIPYRIGRHRPHRSWH